MAKYTKLPTTELPDIRVNNSISVIASFRYWSEADDFCNRYTTQNPRIILTAEGPAKDDSMIRIRWQDGRQTIIPDAEIE